MKKILIVVDMQNDFIDGALGTKEAQSIVQPVVNLIKNFDGPVVATRDTHYEDYSSTLEGKMLPVEHCIINTDGWELNPDVKDAVVKNGLTHIPVIINKKTFGHIHMPEIINTITHDDSDFEIYICGLCTDICVISNALILRANYPNTHIKVVTDCCAGVTPETHQAALDVMKCCQIEQVTSKEI